MLNIILRFPLIGTRFVHSSEGRLLIDRLIPCVNCATEFIQENKKRIKKFLKSFCLN